MYERGVFKFADYDLSDGCWPPSLAPILIPILIATMIGSQETECKDLHAVDISIFAFRGSQNPHPFRNRRDAATPRVPIVLE
jgi:hypothetical protein